MCRKLRCILSLGVQMCRKLRCIISLGVQMCRKLQRILSLGVQKDYPQKIKVNAGATELFDKPFLQKWTRHKRSRTIDRGK